MKDLRPPALVAALKLALAALPLAGVIGHRSSMPPPVELAGEPEFLAPHAFAELIASRKAVVLSLDSSGDFERHHIVGSACAEAGLSSTWEGRIRGERQVAVYSSCCAGRAAEGIQRLRRRFGHPGVRVSVLAGGLPAWQMAGFPVEGSRPEALPLKAPYRSLEELVEYEPRSIRYALTFLTLEEARVAAASTDERRRIEERIEAFHYAGSNGEKGR